jgi:hypothetical protein
MTDRAGIAAVSALVLLADVEHLDVAFSSSCASSTAGGRRLGGTPSIT